MGKIPEFQRDRFASTYVGAPQVDTSGVTAVEGINKAVQPVVDVAARVMHDREVAMIDQQANNALIKYSLAYQQQMKDLEAQYADNPAEFPNAVAKLGTDLQAEYSAAIPDERIRSRFGEAANGVVKQSSQASLRWTEVKQEENAYTAWIDSLDTGVKSAAMQSDINTFTAGLGQIANIARSNTLTSPEKRLAAEETKTKEAVYAYMNRQLDTDARTFWNDLDSGKYDNLTYTTSDGKTHSVPFSLDKKREYIETAEKAYLTQRADKDLKQALRVTGNLQELALKVDAGTAGLQELMYERERIYNRGLARDKNGDPVETPATTEEKDNIDSLIKLEVSVLAKSGKTDPYVRDEINTKWDKLSDAIDENSESPQKFTTELLKFGTMVNNAYADGKITTTEYKTITGKLAGPRAKAIAEQNGQREGFLWARKYQDPLGAAYKALNASIEDMTLTADQKVSARVRAYNTFMDAVVEAESGGAVLKAEDYQTLTTRALRKTQGIYFPNVGEPQEKVRTVRGITYRYTGLDSNGRPNFLPDNAVQEAAKMTR